MEASWEFHARSQPLDTGLPSGARVPPPLSPAGEPRYYGTRAVEGRSGLLVSSYRPPSRRYSWFLLEVYSWPCPTFTPTLCSFFSVGYPNRPQLQEPQLQSSEPCCLRHPPGSLHAQSHRPAPAAHLLLCCPPADIPLPGRAPRYPHLRGSPSQSLSLTQLLPGPFAPHPHQRSPSSLP